MSSDVEVYKGYQIEYQAREAAGIVRVTANVTAEPPPAGQRPQRFAAEARDPVDARISARGQATYWSEPGVRSGGGPGSRRRAESDRSRPEQP